LSSLGPDPCRCWGKFGRRWSSCAGVRTVDLRPKRSTFGDISCGTLSGINFKQPPEAKPIAQARLSGLLWTLDHRCSGVTVRKVARYRKPSRTPQTRVTGSRPTCLSVALQLSGAPARRVTAWAASGCRCTETCPVTRELRASRHRHVQPGQSGRLRGARSLEDSFHRPLVRRAGWRLVRACGNKEADACRPIDELARSGGCWAEALHRSHTEAGDFMGASRPRARSVPRTSK
jgi:hypothetical protein